MEKITRIQEYFRMKIENPFWDETFLENLPRWIHIWLISISFISSLLFAFTYLIRYIDKDLFILKIFAMISILTTLLLILNRDSFLPFLGDTFIPSVFLNLIIRNPKKSERTVLINCQPNKKVIYWAADPGTDIQKTWKNGYNKFENSGVVLADNKGVAKIPIKCPTRYIVHGYKILPKHLHYRVYNDDTQILGKIQTILLTDLCK